MSHTISDALCSLFIHVVCVCDLDREVSLYVITCGSPRGSGLSPTVDRKVRCFLYMKEDRKSFLCVSCHTDHTSVSAIILISMIV